ncbi:MULTISPECIES: hypothetical protein [Mycobacteroides]|uniref:hypothetical protein n=1 Tax=Mycobacteroides TaxID=670516 RepID=UPI0009D2A9B2|nr:MULTISPECIES: hypothetical protein [Mycobacteroides]SKL36578.1 Uncharacterised protein [Mycobacteroides abscessus subsp. abscessus]
MTPIPDLQKPTDDPYSLIGHSWPTESEQSYRSAEVAAGDASTAASAQAQSAADAESKMVDERGRTAESVSGGYASVSEQLGEHARSLTTVSAWMTDAATKIEGAKRRIRQLVSTGTSEIRDAFNSELAGTPVTPSSATLTDHYRGEIGSVAATLATELDGIGHSLVGDPGASRTPTYVRAAASATPTVEQAAVHHSITGEGPHVEPQRLPEMPRATSTLSSAESPSVPGTPSTLSAPTHAMNPTLANLVSGSGPSGNTTAPSGTGSSHGSASGTTSAPAGQQQVPQPSEQHQTTKSPVLPRIPSIELPNIPTAAADIATAVTSSVGHQLPVASAVPATPTVPVSTGITPGTSGAPPMSPVTPGGLAPIGGGLTPPPVTQGVPTSQGTPAPSSPAAPAPAQSPPPARGPVADLAWLQRTYGLAPGLDLPKSETTYIPALFISELPDGEAHLHLVLATLRQQFDQSNWSQPLTVASIRRGLEHRTVYVTADALSIHPHDVLLPHGVIPLDEMPNTPATSELAGSLMVTDKLTSLIPRGWAIEQVLSTVPGGESSQTVEQYQALVEGGELLACKVFRGRDDVTDDEALSTFARASIGSTGCSELDVESARLRSARWVGTQPTGYLDGLARWYLSDAAEAMSWGRWGEAVYASQKYTSLNQSRRQVA